MVFAHLMWLQPANAAAAAATTTVNCFKSSPGVRAVAAAAAAGAALVAAAAEVEALTPARRCPPEALLRDTPVASSARHARAREFTGARRGSLPTGCRAAPSAAGFVGDEAAEAVAVLVARCCGLEPTDS